MDLKKLKEQFDKLSDKEQWEWLMKQDKSLFMIYLDNAETELHFNEDEDCDYILSFKRPIGNFDGTELMLTAMGFNVQCV